jgi:hypothetical protein
MASFAAYMNEQDVEDIRAWALQEAARQRAANQAPRGPENGMGQ